MDGHTLVFIHRLKRYVRTTLSSTAYTVRASEHESIANSANKEVQAPSTYSKTLKVEPSRGKVLHFHFTVTLIIIGFSSRDVENTEV